METSIKSRTLPRHVIVTRLRQRGVRQQDIADRVGCTQAYVSKVYARRVRGTETVEAVWRETDAALGYSEGHAA